MLCFLDALDSDCLIEREVTISKSEGWNFLILKLDFKLQNITPEYNVLIYLYRNHKITC